MWPAPRHSSSALLSAVATRLQAQGLSTEPVLQLNQLDPAALLHARFDHPEIRAITDRVAKADAVVVGSALVEAAAAGRLVPFVRRLARALRG